LLLGRYTSGRLSILSYRPLECEHAFGPSFTLSERDYARLQEMLAAVYARPGDPQPVGWYHSHTRTEIFLSDVDREIHDRFFSQPWQVALVLKPHTFHPTRAGFFFRESDGHIHGEKSYREILLNPLPLVPVSPSPPAAPLAAPIRGPQSEAKRPMITLDTVAEAPAEDSSPVPAPVAAPVPVAVPPSVAAPAPLAAPAPVAAPVPVSVLAPLAAPVPAPAPAAVSVPPQVPVPALAAAPAPVAVPPVPVPAPVSVPVPVPAPVPVAAPAPASPESAPPPAADPPQPVEAEPVTEPAPVPDTALPRFLAVEPQPPKRLWRWVALSLTLAALGGCGYLTRGLWWDETMGAVESALAGGRPPALGLRTLDTNGGELQIQWDAHSPALRKPKGARLTILDGPKLRAIPLDAAHLGSGAFTYARQTQKVEVALAITQSNGQTVREQTTFLGSPPVASYAQVVKERDDLRDENQQLKSDLAKEREKSKKLDREQHYLRDQLERELRLKRLEKQLTPDK
jgi:proteasome lid subunit RPN8/RPN11